mmetsp:Transcript_9116/g.11232  ORF Transcript_9116/g.11232 Transcript_9116/m.11232 type:complete len:126 (-) Transcript_9116:411-788(-)
MPNSCTLPLSSVSEEARRRLEDEVGTFMIMSRARSLSEVTPKTPRKRVNIERWSTPGPEIAQKQSHIVGSSDGGSTSVINRFAGRHAGVKLKITSSRGSGEEDMSAVSNISRLSRLRRFMSLRRR